MDAAIDVYFDFRSPYAYFAARRLRGEAVARRGCRWNWRPVSIDVLLNLQAGRDPWAAYQGPLPAPKRAHLISDVRRLALYYDLPLRAPRPPRPDPISALYLSGLLAGEQRDAFIDAVFAGLWEQQQDVSAPDVLAACLARAGARPELAASVVATVARAELAARSRAAYARGVFGVPSFVVGDEMFFGNDRLDLLLWILDRRFRKPG